MRLVARLDNFNVSSVHFIAFIFRKALGSCSETNRCNPGTTEHNSNYPVYSKEMYIVFDLRLRSHTFTKRRAAEIKFSLVLKEKRCRKYSATACDEIMRTATVEACQTKIPSSLS